VSSFKPCSGGDNYNVNKGNSCVIKCLGQLCISVILYLSATQFWWGKDRKFTFKIHFVELVRMGGRSS
jgi:hypothetical protein